MKKLKKICIIVILLIFSISISTAFVSEASAASRIIAMTPHQANALGLGNSFSTSSVLTRYQVTSYLAQVKRAEADANLMSSIRFGIASSVVTFPLRRLGITMGAGGASSGLAFFIINKDLGSSTIQSLLNRSTASSFKMTLKYERKYRGQTMWFEATSISLVPYLPSR